MKLVSKSEIKKFQEGGVVAPQQTAQETAPMSPEEALAAIVQGAAEAVQTGNAELAMQVCQALVEFAGQAQAQAPQEAPVYQKCGGKMKKKKSKK